MKLHQPVDEDSTITRQLKRRLFWTTRHLLAVVSMMVGLPMPVSCEDVDLEYPVDEDDTDLRPTVPVSGARQDAEYWSPTVASVALFQLHDILGHVVKRLYPSKGVRKTKGQGPLRHLVSIDTVRELEGALRSWLDSLPPSYKLGQEKQAPHIERAKYELCMSYAHAQIYLYRPFLHYLTASSDGGSEGGFPAYASACVDASHLILRLAQDMHREGLLCSVQWDISNLILASSLTMLYLILGRKGAKFEDLAVAQLGTARHIMRLLEPYSMLGRRLGFALKILTTTIIPSARNDISQPVLPSSSARIHDNVENLYTTPAEKGALSVASGKPSTQTDNASVLGFAPQAREQGTQHQPTDIHSERTLESLGLHLSQLPFRQSIGPCTTPLPAVSGPEMLDMPFLNSSISENESLHPTFQQDYQISGDFFGPLIDGTGPIDFSDIIGDLFTSEVFL
ncbi:fungal specific transcription factor domain-containing protein [Aspergillus tanneri]|uniref:Transcription factor domain-containing protein n=1 Tax=Aspergillus tanneri TaxID=1220188 RepID=A0A5M9MLH5_9EURO|nr:uncharacterized protein ATNIH1004_006557 [Aspergillus tanneri]KAA8647855.1 hypothetical protein ATNIH1004_006557 [Aspergillus tanneri]